MLAENLSLREEVLRLQNQYSSTRSTTLDTLLVEQVKGQLQDKLQEIAGLIAGLGRVEEPPTQARVPDPSSWRPKVPNLYLSSQGPRMPRISEDKYYPRRTLEPQEVRALRLSDQSNESPELGPPPVAHFEYEDPIKFDQPVPKDETAAGTSEHDEGISVETLVNLEARRKRKDVQARGESNAEAAGVIETSEVPSIALRTSAKRKLSVRETESTSMAAAREDFRFSRRASTSTEPIKAATSIREKPRAADSANTNRAVDLAPASVKERRVLGDSMFIYPHIKCVDADYCHRERERVATKGCCRVETRRQADQEGDGGSFGRSIRLIADPFAETTSLVYHDGTHRGNFSGRDGGGCDSITDCASTTA